MDNMKAMRVVDDQPANPALGFGNELYRGGPNQGSPDNETVTPLQTIWNRRWIVCITMIASVIGFGLYARTRPKTYTRSCEIVVEPASAKVIGEGMNMESYLNTQAELINQSDAVHGRALTILKEKRDKGLITLKSIGAGDDLADLAAIKDNISAVPGHNADIIMVSFNWPYSDEAAYILSAVAEAFEKFTSVDTHKASEDTYASIKTDKEKWEKEMHEKHAKLADLEGEIAQLTTQDNVGNFDAQTLRALADELTAARVRAIEAKGEFERAAKTLIGDSAKIEHLLRNGEYNFIPISGGRDEAQTKTQLYAAQQKLSDLKERYLPNHPAVQNAQAKLDEMVGTYVLVLNREWSAANDRVKQFEASYDDQKTRATLAAKDIRAKLAMRQAQASDVRESLNQDKKLTDLLSTRMQEITSLDHEGAVRIHLISEPDPQGAPDRVRPNVNMLLLEGLMVGLVLGITLALVDQRLRSIGEVVAATNLPILGVIPRMSRSQSTQTRGRKVHLDPMSDVAEAFRGIRTAVHFGPKSKTVLVTSAERGEGKSTLAANLAIAMCEAGQRVLLVDADLRAPTQHTMFSVSNETGVSSVVAGRSAIDRTIQATGIRGLELLPCGPLPFNPSETINNQMFADLLTELGARYDYIIVDSPPVMAVTDARILGAMCDVTMMVVRAERSHRRAAADARDGLLGFGANLLGIVVNDGPRSRHRYGYYGGYGKPAEGVQSMARVTVDAPPITATDLLIASQKR